MKCLPNRTRNDACFAGKDLKNPFIFAVCAFSPLPSVLGAGVWATKLGQMAGVKVPLVAMHHAYVVTERIEGIQVEMRPCCYSAAQR